MEEEEEKVEGARRFIVIPLTIYGNLEHVSVVVFAIKTDIA